MLSLLQNDAAIVGEVLGGRPQRFEVLVRKYMEDVLRVAWAYTRNIADAEDITQTTFMKTFEGLPSLREPKRFRHWMLTIARNEAHALWRRKQREIPLSEGRDTCPPADAAQAELQALLHAHLEQLPPDVRELIELHHFAGWSTRELSQHLGVTRDAIKKRLERARGELGKSLLPVLTPSPAPVASEARIRHVMGIVLAAQIGRAAVAAPAPAVGGATLIAYKTAMVFVAAGVGVGALLLLQQLQTEAGEVEAPSAHVEQETRPEAGSRPAYPVVEGAAAPVSGALPPDPESGSLSAANAGSIHGENERLRAFLEQPPPEAFAVVSREVLHRPVSLEFEKISLQEVLHFMENSFDVPIHLQAAATPVPSTPVTDGMLTRVDRRDEPMWDVIEAVCEPLGLAPVLDAGYVWISTPALLVREAQDRAPRERVEAYGLFEQVHQPIRVVFREVHLSDVLGFVANSASVNIVIDWRAVAPPGQEAGAGLPQEAPPGFPEGFGQRDSLAAPLTDSASPRPRTPEPFLVHYISLREVQLEDALRALLTPFGLRAELHPEGVVVATRPGLQHFNGHRRKLISVAGPLGEALRRPVSVQECSKTVMEILAGIQSETGLPMQVDSYLDMPRLNEFSVRGPLEAVVALLALHVNAQLAVENDTIYFGPEFRLGAQGRFVELGGQ